MKLLCIFEVLLILFEGSAQLLEIERVLQLLLPLKHFCILSFELAQFCLLFWLENATARFFFRSGSRRTLADDGSSTRCHTAKLPLALYECNDGLSLTYAHTLRFFFDFFIGNYLQRVLHNPLALAQHDNMVDHLGVRLPVLRQIQSLPCEVVKCFFLQTEKIRMSINCAMEHLPKFCNRGVYGRVLPEMGKKALVVDVHWVSHRWVRRSCAGRTQ